MYFAGKTGLFIYTCSCPFSDNSKVTDLVKVYKGSKIFPKNSNGTLLKGSILHPRPYIQKMHCILQVDRGKEANILQVLCQ
jgi:hypothetical protein